MSPMNDVTPFGLFQSTGILEIQAHIKESLQSILNHELITKK